MDDGHITLLVEMTEMYETYEDVQYGRIVVSKNEHEICDRVY